MDAGRVYQLTDEQREAIADVISIGTVQASRSLSRLTRTPMSVTAPEVLILSPEDVAPLFGGPDAPALGVLVPFHGDVEGNTLLLFPQEGVLGLDRLLFRSDADTDDEMRTSAFAEVGNILTGTLLTVLSSLSDEIILSQPPTVVQDMAGAIVDAVLAGVGVDSDTVLALVSDIASDDGGAIARFVILPDPAGIRLLLRAARRLRITR